MARVVVGMSGGVDSSVTAALLKGAGHDVIGVTLNVWPDLPNMPEVQREDACCALGAVEDARRVADKLDIPYYVLNFREVFEDKVIKDFVNTYARGETPNPCIRCNQFIKFDALLVKARQLGAHRGIALHTIGQRRGLGLATGQPLFVTELRPETNTVVVGGPEALLKQH